MNCKRSVCFHCDNFEKTRLNIFRLIQAVHSYFSGILNEFPSQAMEHIIGVHVRRTDFKLWLTKVVDFQVAGKKLYSFFLFRGKGGQF